MAPPKNTNPNFYDIQPLLFFSASRADRIKALTCQLKKLRYYIQIHHASRAKNNRAYHENQRDAYSHDYTNTIKTIRRLEN